MTKTQSNLMFTKTGYRKGLYNIYKPSGWTSFDVVNKIRGITREKKVGHGGTLDPQATGVLVVAVGKEYTRTLQTLLDEKKTYLAEISFGVRSNTYDAEGEIEEVADASQLTGVDIEAALDQFRGEIMQKPPVFSALKKDGKRLYEYARKGQEVEIEARPVTIYGLELIEFTPGQVAKGVLRGTVSKGTYMRSLAHDLGEVFNVGALLSKLEREAVGPYRVEDSLTIERFTETLS